MKNLNKLSRSIKLDTLNQVIKPRDGEYYESIINNPEVMESRPWKNDVKYFTKAVISSIALLKMSKHAVSGGNIEIMGMLVGKIHENCIIVNDAYPLPVEGTETRVNAQIEGYEFMVSYLTQNKLIKPNENIVGWYHSHPGYGCWLSGIDVATQSLNQNFQDPYMAIVIDPKKSLQQGSIEIGAFRTFPDDYVSQIESSKDFNKEKKSDDQFGMHSHKYYALDVEIFKNKNEEELSKLINQETWINELTNNEEIDNSNNQKQYEKIDSLIDKQSKINQQNSYSTQIRLNQRVATLFEKALDQRSRRKQGILGSEDDDNLGVRKSRHALKKRVGLFENEKDIDQDTEPAGEYDDEEDEEDEDDDEEEEEDEEEDDEEEDDDEHDEQKISENNKQETNDTKPNDDSIDNDNDSTMRQTNHRLLFKNKAHNKDPRDNGKTTELFKQISSSQYKKLIKLDIENKLFQ